MRCSAGDPLHYNPDDFSRIKAAEDTHFWFVSRNNVLTAILERVRAPRISAGPLLEIGCGTGNTLRIMRQSFPAAALIGMDALHAGLLHAKDRTNASLVEGRIEEMPFRARFRLIGMFDVLEHLDDDVVALTRVRRVLDPSGTLIVTVPANPALWSRFDDESHHRRRYREPDLRAALSAADFRVDYVTHFMSLTYPALWISRHLERLLGGLRRPGSNAAEPAIVRELRVPVAVNRLFVQLLRLEASVIRRRRCLPFGSSLLAVARPISAA